MIAAIVVILLYFLFANRSNASEMVVPGAITHHVQSTRTSTGGQPVHSFRLAD